MIRWTIILTIFRVMNIPLKRRVNEREEKCDLDLLENFVVVKIIKREDKQQGAPLEESRSEAKENELRRTTRSSSSSATLSPELVCLSERSLSATYLRDKVSCCRVCCREMSKVEFCPWSRVSITWYRSSNDDKMNNYLDNIQGDEHSLRTPRWRAWGKARPRPLRRFRSNS